jgi:uncharacterized membrane protein
MSAPATSTLRWLRFAAAVGAVAAAGYLTWIGLQGIHFYYSDYALLGPLAFYLAYLAAGGIRSLSRHELLLAFGGSCLVVAGSLVGHALYMWYRNVEVIPYSTSCITSLVRFSAISAQTHEYLAPALIASIATFELGRRHFTNTWRLAYLLLAGLGVALFVVRGYLRLMYG